MGKNDVEAGRMNFMLMRKGVRGFNLLITASVVGGRIRFEALFFATLVLEAWC